VISDAADQFGSQCIVVAIDARRITEAPHIKLNEYTNNSSGLGLEPDSKWEVFINGGRTPTGIDALSWATYMIANGAGELLITSMDSDGHQEGYDIDLMSSISTTSPIPVIASGGAGSPFHMFQVLSQGNADAVLAASIFHYGKVSISEAKVYLSKMNVPIRNVGC
jgi:cyclase